MLIALFTLLVITGMGLIAVQTSTEEIQASGNYKLEKQAEQISYTALATAMGQVSVNGDAFWTFMKQQALAQAADSGTNVADVDKQFAFGASDFTGKVLVGPGDDVANLNPAMRVEMSDPLDGFTAAGYSAKFCFKRFRFDSFGSVGVEPTSVNLNDPHARFSLYQHRAYGLLGPIECEGN